MNKRVVFGLAMFVVLSLAVAAPALALSPGTQGQPSMTCGDPNALMTPGHSAAAPGSAFNPDGKAGTVYAGTQPQNSNNPMSVSQYDVACFQVSQPHP